MTRIVALGEIMARLSSPGHLRLGQCMPGELEVIFAGAEASVAMSIAHLGGDAAFVTALPDHAIADACVASVRSVGVDTRQILRTAAGRLGLYFLEAGINQRPAKVIYDREGSSIAITPPSAYDWEAIFASADWLVISGITPAISAVGAELTRVAVHEATIRGVQVLCDFNYRGKLWHWDPATPPRQLAVRTIAALMPSIDLFVAGSDEMAEILAVSSGVDAEPPSRDAPFAVVARRLAERFPRLAHVATTVRNSHSASRQEVGGLLLDVRNDRIHAAPRAGAIVDKSDEPASVADESRLSGGYLIEQIVDRIGTGDAFTAGLLFALTTPEWAAPERAIAFATAAYCLSHSVHGDFHFSTREEIEELVAGDTSGRVQR